MKVIKRDLYLNRIIEKMNNGLIKVITGIRRSGKSYLLFELFYNYLISIGVKKDNIIKLALDDEESEAIIKNKNLSIFIKSKLENDSEQYYLLLDEIQYYDGFEKALNSLLRLHNVDIYVTGSNSKFLSSDILTEFRGRGDEIRIYPLSFSEFKEAYNDENKAWLDYYTYGGFPLVINQKTDESKAKYLANLLYETYIKDIVNRNKISNDEVLERLLEVLASSVGSSTNPLKLANTFASNGYKSTTDKTISVYLNYLIDSFVINKSKRYDIKGKRYISTPSKYYFTDIGLRNALLNFRQQEENHIMENIIYNELLVRGYNVDVGIIQHSYRDNQKVMNSQFEVDFVCNRGSKRYYIQSAFSIPDEMKMAQEKRPLILINDSFKKIIVVKEEIKPWINEDGILIIGLKDFLLDQNSLDI